jgi:hypothetical protein
MTGTLCLLSSHLLYQEASKRLSIRKLPPVLSFQFKVSSLPQSVSQKITQPTAIRAQVVGQVVSPQDRLADQVSRLDQHDAVHHAGHEFEIEGDRKGE